MRNSEVGGNSRLSRLRALVASAGLGSIVLVASPWGHRLRAASLPIAARIPAQQASVPPNQGNTKASAPARLGPHQLSNAEAALQRGTLTVWVPAGYTHSQAEDNREYDWKVLLGQFNADFPAFDLRFLVLDAAEFVQKMHPASQDQQFPDVAFIDNFQELAPLMKDKAVLKTWGDSRFPYNGWWVAFRQGANLATAESFLLWLSQPLKWKPWSVSTNSISPADVAAAQALSQVALQDFAKQDAQALWSIMDPDAGRFLSFGPDVPLTPLSVKPLLTFGNSRLAFVLLAAVGEGEQAVGMDHAGLVLRKTEAGWKILLFLPQVSLPELEELFESFDRMGLEEDGLAAVPKVEILAPPDHAQLSRFPRAEIEWAAVDAPLVGYVVESEFTNPGREHWTWSRIKVISPISNEPSVRMAAPFGAGKQPHRWRIWAISRVGIVSISEWRVIDFTN